MNLSAAVRRNRAVLHRAMLALARDVGAEVIQDFYRLGG